MYKYTLFLIFFPFVLFSQNETQEISIDSGWSMFSTYITPENSSLENIFSPIIEDIIIIKDEYGNVYWPEYNLNSIGNIQPGEAY